MSTNNMQHDSDANTCPGDIRMTVSGIRESSEHRGEEIRLLAVGDVCLGLWVKKEIAEYGSGFPFEKIQSVLKHGDVVFGNLECVISASDRANDSNAITMMVPDTYAEGLQRTGFTILNIANNHMMDFGERGLRETIDYLESRNIGYVGGGNNEQKARSALVIEKKGITLGLLGYADNSTGNVTKKDPSATMLKAGIARYNEKNVLADLSIVRKKVDIVIISLHVDLEFSEYPAPGRTNFCRLLIENGAHLILQHHPHVPQGIEMHKGGLIAYSLGNFVFPVTGNEYMVKNSPHCNKSFILDVSISKSGITGASVIPVQINNNHQPELMRSKERSEFLNYLTNISVPLKNDDLLEKLWFKTGLSALRVNLNYLKGALRRLQFSVFFSHIVYLFQTTEHRRWMHNLLSCMGKNIFVAGARITTRIK